MTGSPPTVSATNWMESFLLGLDETALLKDRSRCLDVSTGEVAFRHTGGATLWPAGKFECISLGTLQERVAGSAAPRRPLIPICCVDGIDIGKAQAALTTEDKAMVQIASNFNALEVPNREAYPDYGGLVTNYAVDTTQGPAASFGVPAACLLRAHFPFYREGTEPASWGQTARRQVELLSGVREWFGTAVNGKVTLRGDEAPIGDGDEALIYVSDRIMLGLHADAQVVFDRGPRAARSTDTQLTVLPASARPLVDQILSASVNVRSPGNVGRGAPASEQLSKLVRACLRAAYRGAYLAAILRGRRKLLLTLIGGGIFANPLEDILDAIAAAHADLAPISQLEEVRLCLYEPGSAKIIDAQLKARLDKARPPSPRGKKRCGIS